MTKRKVTVGGVELGGGHIAVQSMTTTKTSDVDESVAQILRLEEAGCEIARVAISDEEDARALPAVRAGTHIPIVADVHFSARLAVLAVENGAHKLRINPGNLGGDENLRRVADCVKAHGVPVRVGANMGSLEKSALAKFGRSAEALAESALLQASALEKSGVRDIVLSVKASDVPTTVRACRLLAEKGYPLHIGVTEAGVGEAAIVKSSVGIGALLLEGVGDTLRVSLSDDPVREVEAAHEILRACGIEKDFVEVVACPTCGRCRYDCLGLAKKVADRVKYVRKPLKVAVMGCVVNGPGEAKGADLAIAGGEEYCLLLEGEKKTRVPKEDAERAFLRRLEELLS